MATQGAANKKCGRLPERRSETAFEYFRGIPGPADSYPFLGGLSYLILQHSERDIDVHSQFSLDRLGERSDVLLKSSVLFTQCFTNLLAKGQLSIR
jgi:hypothetical protein